MFVPFCNAYSAIFTITVNLSHCRKSVGEFLRLNLISSNLLSDEQKLYFNKNNTQNCRVIEGAKSLLDDKHKSNWLSEEKGVGQTLSRLISHVCFSFSCVHYTLIRCYSREHILDILKRHCLDRRQHIVNLCLIFRFLSFSQSECKYFMTGVLQLKIISIHSI